MVKLKVDMSKLTKFDIFNFLGHLLVTMWPIPRTYRRTCNSSFVYPPPPEEAVVLCLGTGLFLSSSCNENPVNISNIVSDYHKKIHQIQFEHQDKKGFENYPKV